MSNPRCKSIPESSTLRLPRSPRHRCPVAPGATGARPRSSATAIRRPIGGADSNGPLQPPSSCAGRPKKKRTGNGQHRRMPWLHRKRSRGEQSGAMVLDQNVVYQYSILPAVYKSGTETRNVGWSYKACVTWANTRYWHAWIPDVKGGSCTKLDLDKASKTQ